MVKKNIHIRLDEHLLKWLNSLTDDLVVRNRTQYIEKLIFDDIKKKRKEKSVL